jgi:hypothetical protein
MIHLSGGVHSPNKGILSLYDQKSAKEVNRCNDDSKNKRRPETPTAIQDSSGSGTYK